MAFATRKNRIALKGKLDIGNERFVDVTVAVLDAKGCAKIRQKISGPFSDPRLDKVSTLGTAIEPFWASSANRPGIWLTRERARPFTPARWPSPGKASPGYLPPEKGNPASIRIPLRY